MTPRRSSHDRARRITMELRDRETVKPLELYFDLVFVLGFTQCTALMAAQPTWSGIGRGMLTLAVIWWAWACYAWLTTVVEPEEGAVRLVMLGAMAGLLIAALCIPEAFGDRALAFVAAYGAVRLGGVALYLKVSRDSPALHRTIAGFAACTTVVIGLLAAASAVDGGARAALWLAAILLDWGAPAAFGVATWRLVPAHFAERHNLVMIIALGESIVALGAGAHLDLTVSVVSVAVLGVGLASALWWIYFDVVSLTTARRLRAAAEGRVRNALARDSYSYLHFPMVAGIVLGSLGLEETLAHPHDPLDAVHAFALLAGTALYLLAHVALRLRNARSVNVQRFGLAVLLVVSVPVAVQVDALVTLGAVNVLLWAMVAYETLVLYDERRYQLRHGFEVDVPGTR